VTEPSPRPLLLLADSAGGIGRHVADVVAGCAAAGIAVRVAGPEGLDPRFGFSARGAVFVPIPVADFRRPQALAGTVELARQLRRHRVDVVHAHGLRAGAVAVSGAAWPGAGAPAVIVSRHNLVPADRGRAQLPAAVDRLVARRADVMLAASSDLAERARRSGARDVRPGPVAAPAAGLTGDRAVTRGELELGDRPLVLAVGRLAQQKDYPTLLAAARAWRAVEPWPLLAIAGAGPLRAQLADRIAAQGLPVRLLGARPDVSRLLAAADVAVLSSVWEARSLYAQEALRAGVPLVATAVGGIPELVGDAAVLVPPGDPRALAEAVVRVLREPTLRFRLAAAGPARAAQWPTQEQISAGLLELYRELSACRRARPGGEH
jgi:glycosyltransferase involved in cell wall biosynthesis